MEFIRELNDFKIYREQNETFHSGYKYKNAFPFETVPSHVQMTLWFQDNWYHSITIAVTYFIGIKLVQKWMEKREAMHLDRALFWWNSAHALYSFIAISRLSEDFFYSLSKSPYDAICRTCKPDDVAAFWCVSFALSKVLELGDTLFIVLRKRPLIFLHYYHHAAVLVYTIHSGSEHNSAGRAFILMNLFAHCCMYTYYAIKALKFHVPKVIAMSVTCIQTAQMLAGVALSITVYIIKKYYGWRCQQSFANVYLAFFLYTTFAVLFVQFFIKSYIKSDKYDKKAAKKTN